ncbi:MAG: hypothetical protein WCK84_09830 [Bacteroidota bacterium]
MKVRSIPPITSTGKTRRRSPALLNGLAHISLGRYMSEMSKIRKQEEEGDTWSVARYAKSEFNRKSTKKVPASGIYTSERKITCKTELIEDQNGSGDLVVCLQFDGIDFLAEQVTNYSYTYGTTRCCFLVPVTYINKAKEFYLLMTTIGDIFEYEVVRDNEHCCKGECLLGNVKKGISSTGEKEFCPNRLFRGEAYIPELLHKYDPMSMQVAVTNNNVIVVYKKK